MAARRLIAVMLVLLFLSSLAAALAPVETRDEQTSSTAPPRTAPSDSPAAEAELVQAELEAGARRRQTVEVAPGDQLQLLVSAPRIGTVELVGLGPTDDVAPGAPARFDVLLPEAGVFPVRFLENGRRIGTIVVAATPRR